MSLVQHTGRLAARRRHHDGADYAWVYRSTGRDSFFGEAPLRAGLRACLAPLLGRSTRTPVTGRLCGRSGLGGERPRQARTWQITAEDPLETEGMSRGTTLPRLGFTIHRGQSAGARRSDDGIGRLGPADDGGCRGVERSSSLDTDLLDHQDLFLVDGEDPGHRPGRYPASTPTVRRPSAYPTLSAAVPTSLGIRPSTEAFAPTSIQRIWRSCQIARWSWDHPPSTASARPAKISIAPNVFIIRDSPHCRPAARYPNQADARRTWKSSLDHPPTKSTAPGLRRSRRRVWSRRAHGRLDIRTKAPALVCRKFLRGTFHLRLSIDTGQAPSRKGKVGGSEAQTPRPLFFRFGQTTAASGGPGPRHPTTPKSDERGIARTMAQRSPGGAKSSTGDTSHAPDRHCRRPLAAAPSRRPLRPGLPDRPDHHRRAFRRRRPDRHGDPPDRRADGGSARPADRRAERRRRRRHARRHPGREGAAGRLHAAPAPHRHVDGALALRRPRLRPGRPTSRRSASSPTCR